MTLTRRDNWRSPSRPLARTHDTNRKRNRFPSWGHYVLTPQPPTTTNPNTGNTTDTDSDTDTLYATDFGPSTGLVLTNNDLNWIYVEYNAGTPTITVSLSQPSEYNTKILLGTVYRIGTVLHISNHTAWTVANHAKTMINRLQDTMPFARGSGGTISEAGTRNVAVSAGSWWEGLNNFTTSAKDTSVSGSFSYFYKDGASGWTEVVSQTQIDNTQYDDGSGTLATLANSRYGVHWLYLGSDSDLYVIYGTGSYTLADAEISPVLTSTPPQFEGHARLLGKVIIGKSASTFTDIQSVFTTAFAAGAVSNHDDLGGLQGGIAGEHYHLTAAENTSATTKVITFSTTDPTQAMATGDGKAYVHIPSALNGMDITSVHAEVITAGTTGTCDIQIHNVNLAADVLSTKLTIDSGETGSDTAATPAVINTSNDALATNDVLRMDIDAVHTTPASGLYVTIECKLP